MKRVIFFYLICFFFLIIYSCNREQKKSLINSFKKDFEKILDEFPDTLVSHFPNKYKTPLYYQYQPGGEGGNISIQLNESVSDSEMDSIEIYLNHNAKAVYRADDTCLLVVNRFMRMNKWGITTSYSSSLDRSKSCNDTYFPVPNFWNNEVSSSKTKSRLSENFFIYVINAEYGIYSSNLCEVCQRYMPVDWKSGYSKGVALNKDDSIIIYWTIIW